MTLLSARQTRHTFTPHKRCGDAAEANGDIYKKTYTGLYCIGCESFKTEKEIVDGKCANAYRSEIRTNF